MAKLSTQDLLDAFKEMTLIELSEFVKEFEETFGVTEATWTTSGCTALPTATRSKAGRSTSVQWQRR